MAIRLPSCQIPHSDVTITSAADQDVIPGNHCPHAHNVSLQSPQCVSLRIENMDLGIVQCNDDVFGGQMKTRDHTTLLRDVSGDVRSTVPPSHFDLVFLFEMRPVCSDPRSSVPGAAGL